MKAPKGSGALLIGLFATIQLCAADFTGVSFDRITESDSLNLTWDNSGLNADSFPLVVAVSLINQTNSGVFSVKTNVSTTVNTTSFFWQGLPWPAPYLPTAQYQVEIRSSRTGSPSGQSVVARSPFFLIHQVPQQDGSSPDDTSDDPAPGPSPHSGLSRNVSIAVGIVVGIFSIMALGLVAYYFRRRQRRIREARRRQKRLDFVIS